MLFWLYTWMNNNNYKDLAYNYVVNVFDGGFFGFALGFASFSTVIPLFISTLTDSAILIGLIPAFHTVGWQLPQLFTARRISRLPRYKPYVLLTTIHERIPFLGLALIAWFSPHINNNLALVIAFMFLLWQGFGGGFAGNAWQNMIGKVFPSSYLATFFGVQSAAANLLASGSAILAGAMLERLDPPLNYALCFLLAGLFMVISFVFIALTREPARIVPAQNMVHIPLWHTIVTTIKSNRNFTAFLVARILSQFGLMAFAFYIVYAVRYHGMSEGTAGIMTSVLFFTQVISNPVLGQLADRWSRKHLMEIGAVAITISALLAWQAPDASWFYLVFILAGIANTTFWSISMALTLDFGTEDERPTYVGMANTLIAPGGILAPLLGGWLADTAGYGFTFVTAAAAGLITAALLFFFVHEPQRISKLKHADLNDED
jgi:MFS family permease